MCEGKRAGGARGADAKAQAAKHTHSQTYIYICMYGYSSEQKQFLAAATALLQAQHGRAEQSRQETDQKTKPSQARQIMRHVAQSLNFRFRRCRCCFYGQKLPATVCFTAVVVVRRGQGEKCREGGYRGWKSGLKSWPSCCRGDWELGN